MRRQMNRKSMRKKRRVLLLHKFLIFIFFSIYRCVYIYINTDIDIDIDILPKTHTQNEILHRVIMQYFYILTKAQSPRDFNTCVTIARFSRNSLHSSSR